VHELQSVAQAEGRRLLRFLLLRIGGLPAHPRAGRLLSFATRVFAALKWLESGRQFDQCGANCADHFLGSDILEASLLVEGLMSAAQSERVWNDQHAELAERKLQSDLRPRDAARQGQGERR
jgi:hypothetical protein